MFLFITAVVFVPTTVLLTIGMLPTMVASFVDNSKEKMLGLTIGAMNLAGCTPFVLQLWTGSHTMPSAIEILSDPFTIVVMYFAAGIGYMIEWSFTGMVAIFMTEKAKARLEEIEKECTELERTWGREVTGQIKLDDNGFPLKTAVSSEAGEEDNKNNSDKE